MKKTLQINIGGFLFTIEEDAYQKLHEYLNSLRSYFSSYESCDEILKDIEARIAEKFYTKQQEAKVINIDDVQSIIKSMGTVSDFEAIKEEEDLQTEKPKQSKRLYRDGKRKAIGGVLAGIAYRFDIDVVWVRIFYLAMFLGLFFIDFGSFCTLFYIACWVFLPINYHLAENPQVRKLYRNPNDKVIAGVASGLAAYLQVDVKLVRILFVVFGLMGVGLVFYLLIGIIAPLANSVTEKLQLEGQAVTIQNIEKSVQTQNSPVEPNGESTLSKVLLFPFRLIGMIFTFLGTLIRPFGNFLKIIFGVFLAFIGIVFCFTVLLALGTFFGLSNGSEFLNFGDEPGNFVFNSVLNEIPQMGVIFAFFLTFVPGLAFILFGIRLITNKVIGNRNLWLTLLLLWVVGLVGTASVATKVSMNFASKESVEKVQSFSNGEVLVFDVRGKVNHNFKLNPRFWITGTDSKEIQVKSIFESNGANSKEAAQFASDIQYGFEKDGDKLVFDRDFRLKEGDPFRDQDVKIDLAIPRGQKFKFTQEFLDSFGFPEGLYVEGKQLDYNGDNTFIINDKNEMDCLDCPDESPYEIIDRELNTADFQWDTNSWVNKTYKKEFIPKEIVESILLLGEFKVQYVKGDSLSVKVFSNNEESLNETQTEIRDKQLKIGFKDPFKNYTDETFVLITTPNLIPTITLEKSAKLKLFGFKPEKNFNLSLEGKSSAAVDIQTQKMDLKIDESSNLILQGEIENLSAEVSSKSILKAGQSKISNAKVEARNSSIVELGKVKTKSFEASSGSIIKDDEKQGN